MHDSILFDDSGDYMRAAQAPLAAIWLNTNSATPLELLRLRRQNAQFRRRPWDMLYAEDDNAALRHFHSPVSFYAMHIVRSLGSSDRSVRLMASCVSALTCGFIVWLLLKLAVPPALAVLLALFAGLQSRYIEVSVDPTPHGWYILFSLAFLYFFARFLIGQRPRDLYLTAGMLALAGGTLEFTVELIASIPLTLGWLWLLQRKDPPRWSTLNKLFWKAVGILLAVSFLIWPGGWIRGGYLEDYGELSATVLLKNKSAFGERLSAALIYDRVFAHNPMLLVLVLLWVAGAAWLLLRRRLPAAVVVFSSYTVFALLLGVADHFKLFTYVSEFSLFAIPASGLVLGALLRELRGSALRRNATAAVSLLLLLGCWLQWQQRTDGWAARPWLQPVFAGVAKAVPPGQMLLVNNNREAFSLYLPRYRFEPTLTAESTEARTPARTADVRYWLMDSSAALPPDAHPIATFAAGPGRTETLCQPPQAWTQRR